MKISVIVPAYNLRGYIDRCVESLLGQSEKDIEIILADDGSTDGTGRICRGYRRQDSRVRYLKLVHGGLSRARNRGIDASSGQWLRFVDGDDMLSPFRLEKMLSDAESCGADMAVCGFQTVGDGDRLEDVGVPLALFPTETISKRDFFLRLYTMREINYVAAWNKLYRRELFDGLRYREGKIHEDEGIIHLLVDRCEKIAVCGQPLYFYRQRPGSIMSGKSFSVAQMDIFPFLSDRMEYFFQKGRDDLEFFTMKNYMVACLELWASVPRDFPDGKIYRELLLSMFSDMLSRAFKNRAASKKFLMKMAFYRLNPKKYPAGHRAEILFGG